MFVRIYWWSGF